MRTCTGARHLSSLLRLFRDSILRFIADTFLGPLLYISMQEVD
jgi:hypothetical protein